MSVQSPLSLKSRAHHIPNGQKLPETGRVRKPQAHKKRPKHPEREDLGTAQKRGQGAKNQARAPLDDSARRLTCLDLNGAGPTRALPQVREPSGVDSQDSPPSSKPPQQTRGTQRSGQSLRQQKDLDSCLRGFPPPSVWSWEESSPGCQACFFSRKGKNPWDSPAASLAQGRPSPGLPIAPPPESSLKGSSCLALQHGCGESAGNGWG